MRLTSLSINGFRNLNNAKLTPGSYFNVISGNNGQGKTNLLEALYLLGNPRSFRHARLPDFIGHGGHKAIIQGQIESSGMKTVIELSLENDGRRVELNGKAVHKASELFGSLATVIFSPEDIGMVKQGPDSRRRYLDRAVYMSDASYLASWHSYHRILKQRNQLLKQSDRCGLDTWTEQLAETGANVIVKRRRFVRRLGGMLRHYYNAVSGTEEIAQLAYIPEEITSEEQRQVRTELLALFERRISSDIRLGTTTAGPHRDDLVFRLNDHLLKSHGSTGQQKSFVLALKMAELENYREMFSETPLMLLDDISSELDTTRNRNFLNYLNKMDIQVFITTTRKSSVVPDISGDCALFHMEQGNLTFEGISRHE